MIGWYYRFAGGPWLSLGVGAYDNEAQLRAALRRAWNLRRLPAGFQVVCRG